MPRKTYPYKTATRDWLRPGLMLPVAVFGPPIFGAVAVICDESLPAGLGAIGLLFYGAALFSFVVPISITRLSIGWKLVAIIGCGPAEFMLFLYSVLFTACGLFGNCL